MAALTARMVANSNFRPCSPRLDAKTAGIAGIARLLAQLLRQHHQDLPSLYGVGIRSNAALLITAGDNHEHLRCKASWACVRGVAPVSARSSAYD
ncbi:MAG: hypothetical protein KGQ66_01565 [Acidobacteriota bacterium]|nr:hypothetical protein [Acidobacteriota bacterium]